MGGNQSKPTPEQNYRKEMKREYPHMVSAWPPDDYYRLGDYGKIDYDNGTFDYIGNIKDKGIEFKKIRNPPGSYHKLQSDGTKSKQVELNGKGSKGKGKGEVALKYTFQQELSCLYHGNNPVVTRIKDIGAVAEDVEKLRRNKEFKSEYWIICELIEVDGLVVTVAKSKSSSFTVSGSAEAIKSGSIAAHGEVSLGSEQKMVHTFNKTNPGAKCTPLAKLFTVRVKPTLDTLLPFPFPNSHLPNLGQEQESDIVFAKTAKTTANGVAAKATDEEDETFIELGKDENGESYGIEYFSFTTDSENDEDETQEKLQQLQNQVVGRLQNRLEQATTGKNDTV